MKTDPLRSHPVRSDPRQPASEHLAPEHLAPEPLADVLRRIPRVEGLPPAEAPPAVARWRASWSLRHTLATIGLAPLVYAAYRGAVGPAGDGSPLWVAALLLLATTGAVVLATYLPPRGGLRVTRSSPCAAGAGVHVILAGLVLSTVAAPASGVLAMGLLAFAVRQRLGRAACTVGAP